MCERRSQQAEEQQMRGSSARRRGPDCAKVQRPRAPLRLFPPLRDIIAQCGSAVSLRYHGEVKVAGRGRVINRQLFDSAL